MMLLRICAVAAVIAGAVFGTGGFARAGAATVGPSTTPARRTGDVIVRFKSNVSLASVGSAIDTAKSTAKASTAGSRLVLLHPAPGQSVDAAVSTLRGDADVEFAEPDLVVSIADTTPTDPLYAAYQWDATKIGLPKAWDRTTGSPNVRVAVIDTGVDATHPELAGHLAAGYNFVANNTNTADDESHGTFVAGIIVASANNGQGIAGVCWTCKIMPVKVLDGTGSGSMFNVAQGIDWAVANGAQVINMSLGGCAGASGLQTSVNNAWAAGVVLVAASGNYGATPAPGCSTAQQVLYPAAYPNVVAVGASTQTDTRASFSSYGPELGLVAPGQDIVSTLCTCAGYARGYGTGAGTSFAAPHVAGVAALMIAAGITNNATIVSTLESTATDINTPGFDNETGWGRLNAAAALAPQYPVSWGANTLPSTLAPGATAAVAVTFTNSGSSTWRSGGTNPVRFSYHWMNGACPGTTAAVFDGVRTSLPADVAPGGTVGNLAATVQAPATAGTYCLVYDLVQEGVTWFSWQGAATQAATVAVVVPIYGVSWAANTLPSTLAPGATTSVAVTFANTGSATWPSGGANPVRFSYHWKNGACPGTTAAIFDGVRTSLQVNVPPSGTLVNMAASVQAPATAGMYCLVYDLVQEGVTWFSWQGAATQTGTVTVATPVYGVSWGANAPPSTMTAGLTAAVTATFTNTGTLTWASGGTNPVRFSYHWMNGACPGITAAAFDGLRTGLPADVAPGGAVTTLSATVQAPMTGGTYCLVYDLVQEGVTWFSWQGAATQAATVTVTGTAYAVSWGANTLPSTMTAGATVPVTVSFTNTGTLTWASGGTNPVRFSYHWKNGACPGTSAAVFDGARTSLPADVVPSGTVTNLGATVQAPGAAGTYCLVYDLVREGITWFSWQSAATQAATVTVN